jgi:hypothetical protein
MAASGSSETLVSFYETTLLHIPEDNTLHIYTMRISNVQFACIAGSGVL